MPIARVDRPVSMRWTLAAIGGATLSLACGDGGGRASGLDTAAVSTGPMTTGSVTDGGGSSTGAAPGSSTGGVSTTSAASTGVAATSTGGPAPQTTGGSTTGGFPSEYFMLADPLVNGTMGAAVGGAFGDQGWTVTAVADRVYWAVPRLVTGSVEFTLANVTFDNLPLNDHEVFAMYEGGHGIEHPIGYNPEFRNNAFKSMIRIYGVAEVDRTGLQKIMWGVCPFGAPGYHDGTCPCADPVGFFEEPFGGDAGGWDGSPQRLRIEWGEDRITRYFRNDAEVLSVDWSESGLTFGPEELYVSLGNPRPLEVGTAGMPIGAVFSDVVIEGWTGPASATCG